MARKLPSVDVVMIGFGWTGALVSQELTDAGLQVLALERGNWRDTSTDFSPAFIQDELRYRYRSHLFEEPARETVTFRNSADQKALPMRELGSFLPGTGAGGSIVHWNGQTWRFLPYDFEIRSRTIAHYGKAGNLKGVKQEGGNPFEGARSREYPNPPMEMVYAPTLFKKAATELGFHPFPGPSANMRRPYTNPLGVGLGPCTYCGFCEKFACGNYSKASAQTTILPVLMRRDNFTLRTESEVLRVVLDREGKRATGVEYIDTEGQVWEQPAEMVILASYILHNAHLMLVSGIGQPYDPSTGTGLVGKNYAYQIVSGINLFYDDKYFNNFVGAGAVGMAVDDFNGDNFDHSGLGFIGGGYIAQWTTNARPIETHPVPEGTPKWGAKWKKAVRDNYLRSTSVATHGAVMSYRQNHLDLDPTYKDIYGRPLLRLTFDYQDNEHKLSAYLTDQAKAIAKAMKPREIKVNVHDGHYSIVPYQTTHNTGGTIMGANPRDSVTNKYLQSWDVPNLFLLGSGAFPQNAGYNPTGTVGALAYHAAQAIREQYLRAPGPLVQA
jgi:gluconate 2-dehydrogenase alpha chain